MTSTSSSNIFSETRPLPPPPPPPPPLPPLPAVQPRAPASKSHTPPSSGTRSRKRKNNFDEQSFLDSIFSEIQSFVLVNLRPDQISDRICSKYGHIIPKKVISDKISYWKKNKRIVMPPVTNSKEAAAEESDRFGSKCKKLVCCSIVLIAFLGQKLAAKIGRPMRPLPQEDSDDEILIPAADEAPLPMDDIDAVVLCRLHSFGFIYSHASPTHWYLCFATSPHYEFNIQLHSEDYITLKVSGVKPSTESLLHASEILEIRPDEWGFEESSQMQTFLKIVAPRPISTDKSKLRRCAFPLEKPLHHYISIPFYFPEEEDSEIHFDRYGK